MSRMICQRWMQVAEFGDLPPLVLAGTDVIDGRTALRTNYFKSMPADLKSGLNELATKAMARPEPTPIEIEFQAAIQTALLDGLVAFYNEDWP